MVLKAERGQEVAFDVDGTPKIRFSEAQPIAPKNHGSNHSRAVAYEGEFRAGIVMLGVTEFQVRTVPKAHREAAVEALKQTLQKIGCLLNLGMQGARWREYDVLTICGAGCISQRLLWYQSR
ncbi:MAG: hypothetical protein ACI9W2_000090 [Gammaproteobacteria bacterium]|jgi:hypothetical protein